MRTLVGTPEEQFMPRFAAAMQSARGPALEDAQFSPGGRKLSTFTWRRDSQSPPCTIRVNACNGTVESYTYAGPGCLRSVPTKALPEPADLPPPQMVKPGLCPQ